MRKPITSAARYKDYNSFDKIASKLIDNNPDLFGKPGMSDEDRKRTMRSLGAKIGELDRGKTTWWLDRKAETSCLIKLLDIDPDDMGLQKTGRHIYPWLAFPDLPALNLMIENYWSIATPELVSEDRLQESDRYSTRATLDAWLSPQGTAFFGKKLEWLYVPDMIEYQLLTRKLAAIGRHKPLASNSLREVIAESIEQLRNQAPLILAIRGNPEPDHLKTLVSYRQDAPLLVISPWPLPDLWQGKDGQISNPHRNADETVNAPKDINNWIWTLKPDWRYLLLQWIEQRLNKLCPDTTSFSTGGAQDVLKKLDPSCKWFVSVDDVLVLCQAVSEQREKKLQAVAGSDGDVALLLSLLFNRDTSSLDLIQPLIERRWLRWDLAWEGDLEQEVWVDLAKDLCQLDTMLKQQLILKGIGGFDFQRPILIRLLLRSYLIAALTNGQLDRWAPACFDNQRRPLVDAALDAMSIDQLEVIATQLMHSPVSAANTGASEALFAAIGRRILRKENIGDELPMLANHVLKQLIRINDLHFPLSRPLVNPAQQMQWICVCWAWSLITAPDADLPTNWLFPGWNPALPPVVPDWLNFYDQHWERLAVPMQEFLSVVTRWFASHEKLPAYQKMPLLFKAGLLACAGAGQWPASNDWWRGLIGNPVAEQTLLRQVESADPAVNQRIALTWWPSLVRYRMEKFEEMRTGSRLMGSNLFTHNRKEHGYSALLNWVMAQLDAHGELALTGLDDDERMFLTQHPTALSASVQRQLLKSLAKSLPLDPKSFKFTNPYNNLLWHYGPETATEMEAFLGDKELGQQAAAFLWERAPRKAELLLRKKRNASREALRHLILASPFYAIGDAVDLLKDDPTLLSDEERWNWARRCLPDARQHAQDLMQLLNTIPRSENHEIV